MTEVKQRLSMTAPQLFAQCARNEWGFHVWSPNTSYYREKWSALGHNVESMSTPHVASSPALYCIAGEGPGSGARLRQPSPGKKGRPPGGEPSHARGAVPRCPRGINTYAVSCSISETRFLSFLKSLFVYILLYNFRNAVSSCARGFIWYASQWTDENLSASLNILYLFPVCLVNADLFKHVKRTNICCLLSDFVKTGAYGNRYILQWDDWLIDYHTVQYDI